MEFVAWIVVYALALVLMTAIELLTIWLTRNFADLTIPEFPVFLRRVAVMSVGMLVLGEIPWIGWILVLALYWTLLKRWFDADFMAIVIVTVVSFLISRALTVGVLLQLQQF